jgi:C-terminal peptidase prc
MVEKGRISVISVFPDSPAANSGLKPHDSILTVDGLPIAENGNDHSYLVRGPECSAAVLTVQTPGEGPRQMTMVRQKIQSPYVIESYLVPTADGSRVGYIFIPTFFDETIPGQIAGVLENFGTLDGLILDNRMNLGGSSSVVEPILSYFVSGTLGQFASRKDSRPLAVEADPIQNSQTVPIVVLVSKETVSFGEIFSGALRDAGRARIVGQSTLGNVEVLHGYNLPDGSRLWIAEETFIPANSNIGWEDTGIIPDVEAFADWDTFTSENDPTIAAAITLLGH